MPTLELDLNKPDPTTIQAAVECVRKGGSLLYPTDTIYGLGCDPFNERAVRRLFELKGRPEGRGVLLLVGDARWVDWLAARRTPAFDRLAARFWPGPVTFLLPAAPRLPGVVAGDRGLVGIRWPGLLFLSQLLEALDFPLVSTSASISGQPEPRTGKELHRLFEDRVDLFLDAGDLPFAEPSTVVDVSVTPPRLVRRGTCAEEVEEEIAGLTDPRTDTD